jgi:DNA-binding PucR family transcriptional regulator
MHSEEHGVSDRKGEAGRSQHLASLVEALSADPQRARYYLDLLKPLQEYDREHHGDLVRTLGAYLRHGGNSSRAADALYLHRNSLRYRLARIQALTGLDTGDPDVRLALQIGILLLVDATFESGGA